MLSNPQCVGFSATSECRADVSGLGFSCVQSLDFDFKKTLRNGLCCYRWCVFHTRVQACMHAPTYTCTDTGLHMQAVKQTEARRMGSQAVRQTGMHRYLHYIYLHRLKYVRAYIRQHTHASLPTEQDKHQLEAYYVVFIFHPLQRTADTPAALFGVCSVVYILG